MSDTQFETDAFLRLLTDALRAGPGSPQWHEAVGRLRDGGGGASAATAAEVDDYRLLVRAREDLESGREYRSVRAGPEFTRKVMWGIDEEAAGATRGIQSTTLITLLAAAGIIAVIVVVAVILLRGGGGSGGQTPTPQDLAATPFTTTLVSSDLSQEIPAEWRTFGFEPVVSDMNLGLRGGWSESSAGEYRVGGIVSATSYGAAQTFALETSLRMREATPDLILRLFVAEETPTSSDAMSAGGASRELVAELNNGVVSAFRPDGSLVGEPVRAATDDDRIIHLTIKVDRRFVAVEVDGKHVYAGEHGLSPENTRWPGLRFLARSQRAADDIMVQSIRVLKP